MQIRGHHEEVAVELHLPGPCSSDTIVLSHAALEDIQSRHDSLVTLTAKNAERVQTQWDDRGVAQCRDFDTVGIDKLPPFPVERKRFDALDKSVLQSLDDAAQMADRNNIQSALTRLQLRGKAGEIVSTDRRQLLVQRGFAFRWKDDILIPAIGIFGWRELPQDASIAIGRTAAHFCIRIGPWTFHLAIDKHSRFPRIEQVIPARTAHGTALRMTPEDAVFLITELPRLPISKDEDAEVTVDLNGHVAIRAKEETSSQTTELLLGRSSVTGSPVRFVSNRRFIAQAARMGFAELHVASADTAIVCRDSKRIYVWMPLNPEKALPPTSDAIRISSTIASTQHPQEPSPARRNTIMPIPPSNGHASNATPDSPGRGERSVAITDLITEAEELRTVLADASSRLTRLLSGLKQHCRDSRAMQAAMQSLKKIKLGIQAAPRRALHTTFSGEPMHIRDIIAPGSKLLARRLDQLCSTLECLSGRLKTTLVSVIGDSVGGLVRDAAMGVLDNVNKCLADPGQNPSVRQARPPEAYLEDDDDGAYWYDEAAQARENSAPQPSSTPTQPGRLRETPFDSEPIIFCCVDSIVTRRMIWESVRSAASFFVDGRMSTEVLRVLAVNDPAVDDYYQRTLFAAEQAYTGACTARSTIYTASIAAGLMVHQFAKWLRRLPVDADLVLNLLAAELTVGGAS